MKKNIKNKLIELFISKDYKEYTKECFREEKSITKTLFKIYSAKCLASIGIFSVLFSNYLSSFPNVGIFSAFGLSISCLLILISFTLSATYAPMAFRKENDFTIDKYARDMLKNKEEYIKDELSNKIFSKKEMSQIKSFIEELKNEMNDEEFEYLLIFAREKTGLDLGNAYFIYFLFENYEDVLNKKRFKEFKEKEVKKAFNLQLGIMKSNDEINPSNLYESNKEANFKPPKTQKIKLRKD